MKHSGYVWRLVDYLTITTQMKKKQLNTAIVIELSMSWVTNWDFSVDLNNNDKLKTADKNSILK